MLCCISKYILNRQNQGDGCDNVGLSDDDGHPLVVVVGFKLNLILKFC